MDYSHSDRLHSHTGIRKTYARLELRFYWMNMRRPVTKFIRQCYACSKAKSSRLPPVPASSHNPTGPRETFCSDLMGPYPAGKKYNKYLLVFIDLFSKFVEMFPLRTATAENLVDKTWQLICRWGTPRSLIVDNGSQYASKKFHDFCLDVGINVFHISAYHAQANPCERVNQTIKQVIITTIENMKDWDCHLEEICFSLRTAAHDSTGFSPAYLLMGRELRTPFDNKLELDLTPTFRVEELGTRFNLLRQIARDNLTSSLNKSLTYYNRKTKPRFFQVNDMVWLTSHFLSCASKGISSKLSKDKEGLLKVVHINGLNSYDIMNIYTQQMVYKVHTNELAPFYSDYGPSSGSQQDTEGCSPSHSTSPESDEPK